MHFLQGTRKQTYSPEIRVYVFETNKQTIISTFKIIILLFDFFVVTIHVHQRDVTNELASLARSKRINDANDFEWLKQARFYWRNGIADDISPDGTYVRTLDNYRNRTTKSCVFLPYVLQFITSISNFSSPTSASFSFSSSF